MSVRSKDNVPKEKGEICDCLIHPFQEDPGTSQQQRVMEELLGDKSKIDARTTADLLDFFYQLSMQVNFYDNNLIVSDWRPFFEKSSPFTLATMIRHKPANLKVKFEKQCKAFDIKPTKEGLQLTQLFIFYNTIQPVAKWHRHLKDSELPIERIMESLIKDKISAPLARFVSLNRLAAKKFSIKAIDFEDFFQNEMWRLPGPQAMAEKIKEGEDKLASRKGCDMLLDLHKQSRELFYSFLDQVKLLGKAAEQSMEPSFIPLKDELKKKHLPHLALLFAFLRLFQKLQGQLNGFTKKHLDFFYKEILKLGSKDEVPDQAHVIFAIQKELDRYRVEKGVLLRDGRDVNKEDILFSLDDEIVVNQAQVKEIRTLYVNNLLLPAPSQLEDSERMVLVEGVYTASDATKADGIDKDFQSEVKNIYTLGRKESKYMLPETKVMKPYESARLGFILASPVLFMEGGTRKVTITLHCIHDDNVCTAKNTTDNPVPEKCCEPVPVGTPVAPKVVLRPVLPVKELFKKPVSLFVRRPGPVGRLTPIAKPLFTEYPEAMTIRAAEKDSIDKEQYADGKDGKIFEQVDKLINVSYYYVSQDLISNALKKGLDQEVGKLLKSFLQTSNKEEDSRKDKPYCYCPVVEEGYDFAVPADEFEKEMGNKIELVKEYIQKRKPLEVLFSGDKKWITPSEDDNTATQFNITVTGETTFTLEIVATLNADKDPVLFYDKTKLGEDFQTELPVVKIELDDHIKLPFEFGGYKNKCCVEREKPAENVPYSFYHFFRDVRVLKESNIHVEVCGLKKMVVQNDESIMDVNGPVFPFGARPRITSNFYIGSKEIFCKEWKKLCINFNWKNKPADLRAYYHGYEDILTGIETEDFDDSRFMYMASVLQDGSWFDHDFHSYLFRSNFGGLCKRSDALLETCNAATLFKDDLIRRDCIRYNFIYKEFIKPELLNEDGSVKANAIDADGSLKSSSFKKDIVKSIGTPGIEYIPQKCVNDRYSYCFTSSNFDSLISINRTKEFFQQEPFTFTARNGFFRMTLDLQDFQHSRYSYVLARQMIADGKFPKIYVGPVYDGVDPMTGKTVNLLSFDELFSTVESSFIISENIEKRLALDPGILKKFLDEYIHAGSPGDPPNTGANFVLPIDFNQDDFNHALGKPLPGLDPNPVPAEFLKELDLNELNKTELDKYRLKLIINEFKEPFLKDVVAKIKQIKETRVVIPNEPYTPQITGIDIDYTADAAVKDMNLIHLHPFKNTHKHEDIKQSPTLLASFCNEGNLYLGLEKLIPGTNQNILFQLAEATADSEESKEDVFWYYLDNNIWKPLRPGFEVLEDNTQNLTTTGIIKFALPENMTNTNTVMPADLHWIRASIPKNSRSVSEMIGIHTQAVKATFTNAPANDKFRLGKPIEAEQLTKLEEGDASVKQVKQPYETFGGQVPEQVGMYYVRVSELLRHKGRAIQKFDYERLVLDRFPEVFRAKCINHSFGLNANLYKNDFPYAPGYVIMCVIPDLTKLKAGNSFEPKVPVSLLEKIDDHIRKRVSPFVRFRAMNPRYEKINLCLKVKLVRGKDEVYYKEKLKDDLQKFLAPWAVGPQYLFKLAFGACVNRSTIIGFIESLNYIDFIGELKMRHDSEAVYDNTSAERTQVCPKTPRSILVGGNIEVCITEEYCAEWEECKNDDGTKCCDKKEIVTDICKPRVIL
jgi:hypothetical protein